MLTAFGFDTTTEQVYMTMLGDPGARVSDLASAAGVDEDAVRASLDALADAALIEDLESPTPRPVSPEIGLSALLSERQTEVSRMQQEIDRSRLAIARMLSQRGTAGGGETSTEHVFGLDAIRSRIGELVADCAEEELIFNPVGRLTEDAAASARPVDEEVLRRGVQVRTVFLDSVRNDEFTLEKLRWEIELGAQIRTAPTLPTRMIILDRTQVVVPISLTQSRIGALVLTNEVVVHALVSLFHEVWADAAPLTRTRPRRVGELSAQERHVLRLWAQGHTDNSAARRMEVSVRTVRRLSDNLTRRIGATSRYQLGAKAIVEGWIEPDDLF
ncbi:LuxR C-terminal-related transcriptional regulator [Glycomyces xiaoerkulensis]|uniref:LuxR C-terminal-related transcriptional regulator n=1 Tax=Glycomyces xiaoerkulensis TaxID=2038139 RepID=UPI000C266559|nr:LuxR C-terminal-related transcriptional regulator [Glycomyces xiaoerkulensis]